jgi:hypothetical protein
MVVTQMDEYVLEVCLLGGEYDGQSALIPRITITPYICDANSQFDLLTINKLQGQLVKYVGLDLHVPIFAHGQLYVALSLSSKNISQSTHNVVYPEVLLD